MSIEHSVYCFILTHSGLHLIKPILTSLGYTSLHYLVEWWSQTVLPIAHVNDALFTILITLILITLQNPKTSDPHKFSRLLPYLHTSVNLSVDPRLNNCNHFAVFRAILFSSCELQFSNAVGGVSIHYMWSIDVL